MSFDFKAATPATFADGDGLMGATSQTATSPSYFSDTGLIAWIKSKFTKTDVGLGNVANSLQAIAANNGSDFTDAAAFRNNLACGAPQFDPDFNDASIYLTTPAVGPTAVAAGGVSANQLNMVPIWVPRTRTFTTYAIVTTVMSGTSSIRLGLYNSNSSLQPTTKIDEASATIDTSTGTGTAGVKTVAFTANQTLKPGLYFLASLSDGTPTVFRLNNQSSSVLGIRFTTGAATLNGGKYRTGVTYTTLPADETAQTYSSQASGSTGLPLIGIR